MKMKNWGDAGKTVFRGKFIASNAYISRDGDYT